MGAGEKKIWPRLFQKSNGEKVTLVAHAEPAETSIVAMHSQAPMLLLAR